MKHCNQPFESVEEMDEYLLEQWNSYVGEIDTVYILGDLFFRNAVSADEYLDKLHGKKPGPPCGQGFLAGGKVQPHEWAP